MSGPASAGVPVQIFGRKDSRHTQRALRFFRERRATVSFVDLAIRPMARTELGRFAGRLGVEALLDREGRRFAELGLGYLRMDQADVLERLLTDQALLRLPLVRSGDAFAAGPDETAWRALLAR